MSSPPNPLEHPVVFATPNRLTPFSAWHEHIPFAGFVIDVLKPGILVELGTYYGDSYCAFCQAISELNLDTRCFAIDQGDSHAGDGPHGPEVLTDLRAWHDPLYGRFSQLIQSPVPAALGHFRDQTIDLLHIDGCHRGESVQQHFESWLPKLSARGVVLLHDTNARERDVEAHEFWEKIKTRYPHFEFLHGGGLGVLAVGPDQPERLRRLYQLSPEGIAATRRLFFCLGHRLTLLAEREGALEAARRRASELAQGSERVRGELAEREQTLATLRLQVAELGLVNEGFKKAVAEREQATAALHRRVRALEQVGEEARKENRSLEAQASHLQGRLGEASQRVEKSQHQLALWQYHARAVSTELAALRRRRILRVMDRLRPGPDFSSHIGPAFRDLLDDSYLFFGDLKGYRLQPSAELHRVRHLTYTLPLTRPNLSGLMLAPIIEIPDGVGSLAIELATPDGLIVARDEAPLSGIDYLHPVRFVFSVVSASAQSLILRVDVRNTTAPVRLFEWRRRRLDGLGRLVTRPFCALLFTQARALDGNEG